MTESTSRGGGRGASRHPSLTKRLAAAVAAAVFAATLAASGVLFAVAYEDACDHQDDLLEEVSGVMARANAAFSSDPPAWEALSMDDDRFEALYVMDEDDPQARIPAGSELLVMTLHKDGRAVRLRLERPLDPGESTLRIEGEEHRIYARILKNGRIVAVAQRTKEVWRAARVEALRAAVPLLALSAALLLVIFIVVWRVMRPVRRLALEASQKSGEELSPLDPSGLPSEVLPLVEELNGLLARVRALRDREARFVADAAHELRSPLAALSLQTERLEKENLTPEARAKLAKLKLGIDRAVRQVSQLLALKRAQSGEARAETSPADFAETAARAIESVFEEAESKSVELAVDGLDGAPSPFRVKIPADDLFTILRNLLENAVRYAPVGGRVLLKLDNVDPLGFSIEDDGPGIPPEERPRVFDPFYRVLGTGVEGTGLGLAIVKTLAERSGFEVKLEDADPAAADGRRGLRVRVRSRVR